MLNSSPADYADMKWMYQLLIQAANKGHFEMRNTQVGRETIKRNIHSIVMHHEIIDLGLSAKAIKFESQLGKVGYVVISDTRPGLDGKEIYIFVVEKQYRGYGYGQAMLEEVMHHWNPVTDIYARCLPASRVMAKLLSNNGFYRKGVNSDGAEIYLLEKFPMSEYAV